MLGHVGYIKNRGLISYEPRRNRPTTQAVIPSGQQSSSTFFRGIFMFGSKNLKSETFTDEMEHRITYFEFLEFWPYSDKIINFGLHNRILRYQLTLITS